MGLKGAETPSKHRSQAQKGETELFGPVDLATNQKGKGKRKNSDRKGTKNPLKQGH